jgi:undecaprenyl-diphosphatase
VLHAAAIRLAPGPLDRRIFQAVNVDGGAALDAAARVLSSHAFGLGVGLLLALLLAGSLRGRSLPPIAALGLGVGLADLLGSQLLRPLVDRPRPCYALPAAEVRWLLPAANVHALPSLHAANLFALALVATRADRRLGLLAYPVAAAVAWSRVYGGVHWPLDVLFGAAWGTLWGAVAWEVMVRLGARPAR